MGVWEEVYEIVLFYCDEYEMSRVEVIGLGIVVVLSESCGRLWDY